MCLPIFHTTKLAKTEFVAHRRPIGTGLVFGQLVWLPHPTATQWDLTQFHNPPHLNPGIFGGGGWGKKFLRNIPPDHVEYSPPVFSGFQKTWFRMNFILDIRIYWIYQVDIHGSKKQTAYDLCELLPLVFEDIQKRNPTSTMVLHLPPQKFHKLSLGEKIKCTLQTLCTYLTTSTDARWCITTDCAKIFHCLILPYINQKFSSEIFLGVWGGRPPLFWNIPVFTTPPLQGGAIPYNWSTLTFRSTGIPALGSSWRLIRPSHCFFLCRGILSRIPRIWVRWRRLRQPRELEGMTAVPWCLGCRNLRH